MFQALALNNVLAFKFRAQVQENTLPPSFLFYMLSSQVIYIYQARRS